MTFEVNVLVWNRYKHAAGSNRLIGSGQGRIKANLSAPAPSTRILKKLTRPLDAKTQHNCQIPNFFFLLF